MISDQYKRATPTREASKPASAAAQKPAPKTSKKAAENRAIKPARGYKTK